MPTTGRSRQWQITCGDLITKQWLAPIFFLVLYLHTMELDQWLKKQFCPSLINCTNSRISPGPLMLIHLYSICFTSDNIISILWIGLPNRKCWQPVLTYALSLDPWVLGPILISNRLARNYNSCILMTSAIFTLSLEPNILLIQWNFKISIGYCSWGTWADPSQVRPNLKIEEAGWAFKLRNCEAAVLTTLSLCWRQHFLQ